MVQSYRADIEAGFNTSYVSVQEAMLLKKLGGSKVSIHPMCRFKNLLFTTKIQKVCFNTSYVSVQATAK